MKATRLLLLLLCPATKTLQSAAADGDGRSSSDDSAARLSGLFVSHGSLQPPFSPEVFSYRLPLSHAIDTLAIAPESSSSAALVSVSWPGAPEEASAFARREIDLPDDGSAVPVTIRVSVGEGGDGGGATAKNGASGGVAEDDDDTNNNNGNGNVQQEYTVLVEQSAGPVVLLKGVEVVEDTGAAVAISPPVSATHALYNLYCSPDADSLTLRPFCARGNSVVVNGGSHANEDAVTVKREKDHHRQIVTLTCQAQGVARNYVLAVTSDWPQDQIQVPRIVVRGQECKFGNGRFACPDPRGEEHKTRLVAFGEPSVRYTVQSSDGEVEVRLLDEIPSIPFEYGGKSLTVVGQAGTQSVQWPVRFNGSPAPGVMAFFGWLLGLKLLVLLASLLLVLGVSSTCGLGVPIGVTEISAAMTLLLQFFTFASALRGESMLTDLCGSFRWVTLFWPAPFHKHRGLVGDVTDPTNAQGCLVWAPILLVLFLIVHGIVALRVKLGAGGHATFPHRLRFGNWESRFLHWVTFPVAVAAADVLQQEDAWAWKALAGVELAALLAWSTVAAITVQQAIAREAAVWVWHASVREDGELAEDEAGYWADAKADQLLTHPVNRSVFTWLLPWRWVTTVADIQPEEVTGNATTTGKVFGPNVFDTRAHQDGGYPLAKAPRTVVVTGAAAPSALCRGQRLIAGLLRTRALDVLITHEALTYMKHNAGVPVGSLELTVKTQQLSGPVTGGRNHFFFDGVRMPFVRLGDVLWRLIIGIGLGLALASKSLKQDAVTFGVVAAASAAMLCYVAFGAPLARRLENYVVLALQAAIFTTSVAFCGYAAAGDRPCRMADVCLWFTALTAGALSLYACLVLFSIYSAIVCPPLEESRFLEGLANCTVVVADHAKKLKLEMPGYSKRGCRDMRAHCTTKSSGSLAVTLYPSGDLGSLEFPAATLAGAFSTGQLPTPLLSVTVPCKKDPLGYRHLNVFNASEMHTDLAGFLAMQPETKYHADVIARHVVSQVAARSNAGQRGGTQLQSLTIVPPATSLTSGDRHQPSGGSVEGSARQRQQRRGREEIEML